MINEERGCPGQARTSDKKVPAVSLWESILLQQAASLSFGPNTVAKGGHYLGERDAEGGTKPSPRPIVSNFFYILENVASFDFNDPSESIAINMALAIRHQPCCWVEHIAHAHLVIVAPPTLKKVLIVVRLTYLVVRQEQTNQGSASGLTPLCEI